MNLEDPSRWGRLRLPATLLLAATLIAVGCGKGTGTVEGSVTYKPKSKKLVWGSVVITGSDNIGRAGMITPEGPYVVTGVPAGEAKITVSSDNPKPPAEPAGGRGGRGGGRDEDRRPADPNASKEATPAVPDAILKGWFAIPMKYADPAQTTLRVTVKPGKNDHDITLD